MEEIEIPKIADRIILVLFVFKGEIDCIYICSQDILKNNQMQANIMSRVYGSALFTVAVRDMMV